MQPRGILVQDQDGEHATLTFRRSYPHAVRHVWEAISTPGGLREWLLCSDARIEGRAGGRIELVSGPAGYRSTGTILAWEPPRLLEYEWNVQPVPEMPRGERAVFRFELTADGGRTHLVVTYRRITRQTAVGFLPGVHAFLDRLEAQLDGRPLPDWLERFAAHRTEYPEWSPHAPDPGE
jgi:uncharacterized protein YndB with AHSA1/START domain